ncbi:MAG TPA: DUF3631 domain-containing protein [Candidatus Acidoferrum sp.]|nr:DUF3631 domain-containing protein [Candidatus Acidoferrum sp.]
MTPMLPRALRGESLTPAVVYRVVHRGQPTLCMDEVDCYLHLYSEMRALLNAGHKRDSHALRCGAGGYDVNAYNTFCPTVLAGIGHLPPTLRDRSIVIPMIQAQAGQVQLRFNPDKAEVEKILGRKIARWAKDNFAAIAALDDPPLPAIASNRLADNWRPLFTIAHVIAGHWPDRLTDAFHALTSSRSSSFSSSSRSPSSSSSFSSSSSPSLHLPATPIHQSTNPLIQPPSSPAPSLPLPAPSIHQSINPQILPAPPATPGSQPPPTPIHQSNNPLIQPPLQALLQALLADIRQIFAQSGVARRTSAQLVEALRAIPDRPWSEPPPSNHQSVRMTQIRLVRYLAPLGIRPKLLRIGHLRGKGYELADFAHAFNLLPPTPPKANLAQAAH